MVFNHNASINNGGCAQKEQNEEPHFSVFIFSLIIERIDLIFEAYHNACLLCENEVGYLVFHGDSGAVLDCGGVHDWDTPF